ncbi:hypothetical protein V7O66_13895 [Methanolobus sp. ZRKC3]
MPDDYTPCVECGEIKQKMLTIKNPEHLFGEMICNECNNERNEVKQ